MSLISNDLLATIKSASSTGTDSARLATVTSYTDEALKIKFFGDEEASSKSYKRLDSYSPAEDDTVLLINVNGSYVIVGKVV